MNRVKKTIRLAAMLVLVCALLCANVFAAGEGSVWFNAVQNDDQTVVYIVTDAAVTDGLVEVRYDAENLTYVSIEVNEANVAMHAVNADEAGIVKIGWVAPGENAPEENQWLFKVNFAGKGDVTVSGAIGGGETGEFAGLDVSELEKVILEAEGLYEDDYSYRSWKTLEKALDMARDVLADPTADQSEVDAAAETLRNGIASLELKVITNNSKLFKSILRAQGLKKDQYTEESWADLEKALTAAKRVNMNPRATQKQIDEATDALNEAMKNLELKPVEPEVPTEPDQPTEPEKPGTPGGIIGKWADTIRKIIGAWFGRGK
jgi:hypothetical protein